MKPTALPQRAPAPVCSGRLWRTTAGVVLAWEAVAATSRALRRQGIACRQVPYVTDLVRTLPRPGRATVTALTCAAVADHFGKRRWF